MTQSVPKKKNGLVVTIIVIILIILAALLFLKMNKKSSMPQTQSDKDLNQALTSDTTTSINGNLDTIKVDDTSSADLQGVDSDLEKL